MRRLLIVGVLALAACTDTSTDSHEDIPDDDIPIDMTEWTVYANYDGFPNVAVKCDGSARMYTTTRNSESLIVVPTSPECRSGDG